MNLEEHFKGYRTFVKRDVLDGYVEYANSSAREDGSTVSKYIVGLKHQIELEAVRGNKDSYNILLVKHQECLLQVFTSMSYNQHQSYIARGKDSKIAILDMIHIKGWNWFKFLHPVEITFDKFILVPRHLEKHYSEKLPVFDADEMKLLFEAKLDMPQVDRILRRKKTAQYKGRPLKMFLAKCFGGQPHFNEIKDINRLSVVDWTGDIRYEQ